MTGIQLTHAYNDITSVENLLDAWKEFLRGKEKRDDVQKFQKNLMGNIFTLHHDLKNKTYHHGGYQAFKINDPKPRDIHKASVRDRLVHHAVHRVLYPYFDTKFIHDSYSCRVDKGTHKALDRFKSFAHKVSRNNTRTCWVLKCDIRRFFASIDHTILKEILAKHIHDTDTLLLLSQIISSFHTKGHVGKGLPLGNLTSQLLVNIYMNEFDQFAKRELKTKYYIRYADDFVILSKNKTELVEKLRYTATFLRERLKLNLHPNKVSIQTFSSGVDFLGWVHFPHHLTLRTTTKKRMFRRLAETDSEETLASYLGLLSHGDGYKIVQQITPPQPS